MKGIMVAALLSGAASASPLSFVDRVRSVEKEAAQWKITFQKHAAIYHARDEKVVESLKAHLKSGKPVKATVDSDSLLISVAD